MKAYFDEVSHKCSKLTTRHYSTSFSLGISFLNKQYRKPIYGIYGFVRLADEIVDSFHDFNKEELLNNFEEETYKAIAQRISINPILNSFQEAVYDFNIDLDLIDTFLKSMRMDLNKSDYNKQEYDAYILGSAEVVGLMCLKVFVNGDKNQYEMLKPFAMKLGSAFQKINFLRDIHQDVNELGRIYFPGLTIDDFNQTAKQIIEKEIAQEFNLGLDGIRKLPKGSRFGVYMAYVYYFSLFKKIKRTSSTTILNKRVRIPDNIKYLLFFGSYVKHRFNLI